MKTTLICSLPSTVSSLPPYKSFSSSSAAALLICSAISSAVLTLEDGVSLAADAAGADFLAAGAAEDDEAVGAGVADGVDLAGADVADLAEVEVDAAEVLLSFGFAVSSAFGSWTFLPPIEMEMVEAAFGASAAGAAGLGPPREIVFPCTGCLGVGAGATGSSSSQLSCTAALASEVTLAEGEADAGTMGASVEGGA